MGNNPNEITLDDIKKVVDASLIDNEERIKQHQIMINEKHAQEHEFLGDFIEDQRIKKERINAVITQVTSWGAIAVILWIGQAMAKKLGLTF